MKYELPYSTNVTVDCYRCTPRSIQIQRDPLLIYLTHFSSGLNPSRDHSIRHILQQHAPQSYNESPGNGHNRFLRTLQPLQSQIHAPHPRIFRDQNPATLDQGRSHSPVPTTRNSPLTGIFSGRVFGGSQPQIRSNLLGAPKPPHVLEFHKDLHPRQQPYPGGSPEKLRPPAIFRSPG